MLLLLGVDIVFVVDFVVVVVVLLRHAKLGSPWWVQYSRFLLADELENNKMAEVKKVYVVLNVCRRYCDIVSF